MVWIQPRIIDHEVAQKEKENNLWKAECLNERFLLESLTVKPVREDLRPVSSPLASDAHLPDDAAPKDFDEVELGKEGDEAGRDGDSPGTGAKLWRIVMLRTDVNTEAVVVAEDDAEETIRENWNWIEANMLSKLSQIISEEGTEKVDKFLLLQFQMLYINQANEIAQRQIENRRKVQATEVLILLMLVISVIPSFAYEHLTHITTLFMHPQTGKNENEATEEDEMIAMFSCSVWVKLRYRTGVLRVFHAKLTFRGNNVPLNITIFFTDILSVTKETSSILAKQNSLKIKAKDGEYFFSDLDKRDDIYELISQLWNMDMEHRLHKVKLGRTSGETSVVVSPRDQPNQAGATGEPSLSGGPSLTDLASPPVSPADLRRGHTMSISASEIASPRSRSDSPTGLESETMSPNGGRRFNSTNDGSLEMRESVELGSSEPEFLTSSGSLVVGDFVISKHSDQVEKKDVKASSPSLDSSVNSDQFLVVGEQPSSPGWGSGMTSSGSVRTRSSSSVEAMTSVAAPGSPKTLVRERSSSGGSRMIEVESIARSPKTMRSLLEEGLYNSTKVATRSRSGSGSFDILPPRRSSGSNSLPSSRSNSDSQVVPTKKPSMKDILDTKKRNERFRALFQLPTEESLERKFDASLSFRKVFVQGKVYLSPNYACFHSLLPEDKDELRQQTNVQATNAGGNQAGVSLVGSGTAPLTSSGTFGVKGIRDGGVLADNVLRGRRSSTTGFINSSSSSPFLKMVVPFVEITQMGLEDDGPGSYLVAVNTKRNQFVFSTNNVEVFTRIQERKNEACSHLLFAPTARSPMDFSKLACASPLVGSWPKDENDDTPSPINWNDLQQLQEFFGEFKEEDIQKEALNRSKWTAYFKENGMGVDMLKTLEMKKLVYEGIPNDFRARMWQICSGSIYRLKSKSCSGLYQSLFEKFKGQQSLATEQIEKDLHRSFDHPFYQPGGARINALRRVLTAYSWHNPDIGYCQSMNMIAAAFLLYLTEEEAFCLLITLVEDMLKGYYTKEMLGSCVDQRVFEVLLSEHMPRLYVHLTETLSIPIAWFSCPWFLCLFIGKLPLKCVCHILDCFFLDGPCVLFQAGLALFKITENEIMGMRDEIASGISAIMQKKALEDYELFFKVALKDFASITMDKVQQLRNSYKLQVIIDLEEEKRREAEWEEQQKMKDKPQAHATSKEETAFVSSSPPTPTRSRSNTMVDSGTLPQSFFSAAASWAIPTAASLATSMASAVGVTTFEPDRAPGKKPKVTKSASTLNGKRRSVGLAEAPRDDALSSSPCSPQPVSSPPSLSSSLDPSPSIPSAPLSASSSPATITRRRSNTTVDAAPPPLDLLESSPSSLPFEFSPLSSPVVSRSPLALHSSLSSVDETPERPRRNSTLSSTSTSAVSTRALGNVAASVSMTTASSSPSGSPSPGRRGTKMRLADMRSMKERGQFTEFSSWGINVLENLWSATSLTPASSPSSSPLPPFHSSQQPRPESVTTASSNNYNYNNSEPSAITAKKNLFATPNTSPVKEDASTNKSPRGGDFKSKLAMASNFLGFTSPPSSRPS